MTSFANILVIRQSALGDVANIFPVLKLLRQTFPEARLSCLTGNLTAGLVGEDPGVDEVLPFNRTKDLRALLPMLVRLGKAHFDLVVDLQSSRHSRWLALATRARVRLGHGRRPFYTEPAVYDPAEMQACATFLRILSPLGLGEARLEPYFPNRAGAVARAKQLLAGLGVDSAPLAVLNPGHSPAWKTKRWPLEHWITLAERFLGQGLLPVVTGGPGEAAVAGELVAATGGRALATAGKTSLMELAGILALARVVVSTDSGPMHLAAMVGTPVVALFGPTSPLASAPFGAGHRVLHRNLDCSRCFKKECPYGHECLDLLLPETVWQEVAAVLG